MEAEAAPAGTDERDLTGVYRYYELAKRAEWQVRDLPWSDVPPIPEYKGSPQKLARRQDLWRSVITQQLQADELAVEMATQLFAIAPDRDAKLYYTTMVQDESRHTEAWLKLIDQAGGMAERDPYLDQLAQQVLEADTLEEKVFLMQVFFERLIIPRFRLIARGSRGTILEDICNRLAIDDGIHHGSGMAYERILLSRAPKSIKGQLIDAANRMLPEFAAHALWRPKAREMIGQLMEAKDKERLKTELNHGVRLAKSGSTRFAPSISCCCTLRPAPSSRTRSYAIPAPWWMPSSIARRLQRSSSTVPRDERAIMRKRGMIRRS